MRAVVAAVAGVLGLPGALASQVRDITVTAREFAFDAPDTVAAGVVRIRFVAAGEQFHHAQLVRLEDGKSVDDLKAALQQPGPAPSWIGFVGGPNAPNPGAEANATVALRPGMYAWLCFVTTPPPERKPHFLEGMVRPMVVTGTARPQLPPSATLLLLSDYDFTFSAPLTAGRHVIRVRNNAGQPHEVVFVRFRPGATMADLLAWLETEGGPPPADALGGVASLDEGEANLVELDLTPGEYGMICFASDKNDGRPHFAHGMAKTFTVP